MKISEAAVLFFIKRTSRQEVLFSMQNIIPGASFWIVCFSTDEQRERGVTFHTDTGEKILRLPAEENKVLIRDDISKRDVRLERVEMSSQFCFLRRAIFIRIFANSVCIKRTPPLLAVQLWKNILYRKERSSWDIKYFAADKELPAGWCASKRKVCRFRNVYL